MKIPKAVFGVLLVFIPVAIAAGIFFFHSRPEPEQAFRANLSNAQKMLVMLRRAEIVNQQSGQGYKVISAKENKGKMSYSEGWTAMKLPNVETDTGFDYECLPPEGVCQATEAGKTGSVANGIRIHIASGAYSCLGAYKPVTTEGFGGAPVVVACQDS